MSKVAFRKVLALGAVAACAATAVGATATARVGLHVRFRTVIGSGVRYVGVGNGYVFAQEAAGTSGYAGLLIDDRTGAARRVPNPGGTCTPMGIGGGELLFSCGTLLSADLTTGQAVVKLYSISRGTWRSLMGPGLPCDVNDVRCIVNAVRVGAHWIEYDNTSCSVHCGGPPDQYRYANLRTGELRTDPTGGSTIANVDSPSLSQRVCAPVRVPTVPDAYVNDSGSQPLPGSLTVLGGIVLSAGGAEQFRLRRCESKQAIRIDATRDPTFQPPTFVGKPGWCLAPFCGPAANQHTVIWDASPTRLNGRFLPSLKAFSIAVPDSAGGLAEVLLTSRQLYVLDRNGHLWRGRAPVATPTAR